MAFDRAEYNREYQRRNRERRNELSRKYYSLNKEKQNERTKAYYREHAEELKEYGKQYWKKKQAAKQAELNKQEDIKPEAESTTS